MPSPIAALAWLVGEGTARVGTESFMLVVAAVLAAGAVLFGVSQRSADEFARATSSELTTGADSSDRATREERCPCSISDRRRGRWPR